MFAEDDSNIYAHARKNAQSAIALAKQRAQQFDAQAALERKTNEALALAKAQAHLHEDEETVEGVNGGSGAEPLDCELLFNPLYSYILIYFCSGLRRAQLPEPDITIGKFDYWATEATSSTIKGISIEGIKLAWNFV